MLGPRPQVLIFLGPPLLREIGFWSKELKMECIFSGNMIWVFQSFEMSCEKERTVSISMVSAMVHHVFVKYWTMTQSHEPSVTNWCHKDLATLADMGFYHHILFYIYACIMLIFHLLENNVFVKSLHIYIFFIKFHTMFFFP